MKHPSFLTSLIVIILGSLLGSATQWIDYEHTHYYSHSEATITMFLVYGIWLIRYYQSHKEKDDE